MFSFIPRIAAEGLLCARLCVRLMVTIIARIAEGFTTHKSLCCRIPYVPSFQCPQPPFVTPVTVPTYR